MVEENGGDQQPTLEQQPRQRGGESLSPAEENIIQEQRIGLRNLLRNVYQDISQELKPRAKELGESREAKREALTDQYTERTVKIGRASCRERV